MAGLTLLFLGFLDLLAFGMWIGWGTTDFNGCSINGNCARIALSWSAVWMGLLGAIVVATMTATRAISNARRKPQSVSLGDQIQHDGTALPLPHVQSDSARGDWWNAIPLRYVVPATITGVALVFLLSSLVVHAFTYHAPAVQRPSIDEAQRVCAQVYPHDRWAQRDCFNIMEN